MVKTLMARAMDEINSRPLVSIDCLLEALSIAKQEAPSIHSVDLLKPFCEAVIRSANTGATNWEKDPIGALFDRSLRQQQQRFIAVCLLRLLSTAEDIFTKDSDFRIEAFKLFDRTLSHDVYKWFNIDGSDQTFEKENKLKDPVPQIESELRGILSSIHSLDMISNFRSIFMQKINSYLSKTLLWPFWPTELLDIRLDEIFRTIDNYLNEKGFNVLQSREQLISVLDKYSFDAESHGTRYSKEFLVAFADTLKILHQKHFEASPFGSSSSLSIECSPKKYPFHEEGRQLTITLMLNNDGPGIAFDVELNVDSDLTIKKQTFILVTLTRDLLR